MSRFAVLILTLAGAMMAPLYATAEVIFSLTHRAIDTDGNSLELGLLSFQLEWSVDGGPLVYTLVPPGELHAAGATVTVIDPVTVMCEQTIVVRARAVYLTDNAGPWGAQAQATAQECPVPIAPENMTVVITVAIGE